MTIAAIKNNPFECNVTENAPLSGTIHGTNSDGTNVQLPDEEKNISAIKTNSMITIPEMMKITGKSRRTVMRILSNSVRIIRVGPSVGGHWEINEDESAKDKFEKQIEKTVALAKEAAIKEEDVVETIEEYHAEKKTKR